MSSHCWRCPDLADAIEDKNSGRPDFCFSVVEEHGELRDDQERSARAEAGKTDPGEDEERGP